MASEDRVKTPPKTPPKKRKAPSRSNRQTNPKERFGKREISRYNPETALTICERVAGGETITDICKDPKMPARQTFNRWVFLYPTLKKAYDAAREVSAQALEDEALGIARLLQGKHNYTASRIRAFDVALQQLRWSASRRDPARYGNQNTPSLTVPIQINTNLDLGGGADAGQGIYHIEAEVDQPPEPSGEDPFAGDDDEGERLILPKGERPGPRLNERREDKAREAELKRRRKATKDGDTTTE